MLTKFTYVLEVCTVEWCLCLNLRVAWKLNIKLQLYTNVQVYFQFFSSAGRKRIPTVVYPDGSDIIARRLKCVAWRATVEMSKTVSHLLFLVRLTKDFYFNASQSQTSFIFCFTYMFLPLCTATGVV
jgi:hypothetical protein